MKSIVYAHKCRTRGGPSLAETAEGSVLLAFTVGEDPSADIHLARSTDDGRTFSEPRRVYESSGHADAPALAVAGNGRVYLAWGYRETDAPRVGRIAIAHSDDDGRSFSSVRLLEHGDGLAQGAAFPSLAAHEQRIHLIAERARSTGPGFAGLVHAHAAEDASFTALQAVPGGDTAPSGGRQGLLMRKLALHPDGRIFAVHSTFDRGRRSHILLLEGRAGSD